MTLKVVTEELWIVLFIAEMLSGYELVKTWRTNEESKLMVLGLENPGHSTMHFHLHFCMHRHLFCEKYRFSWKALRCTCVSGWGNGRQEWVSAETRSGKEVCVCFQDPPRNAEGARLRWGGNLGWRVTVGGRQIGVRAWGHLCPPRNSLVLEPAAEKNTALTGTCRFPFH